jgi:hypothetical protein
VLLVPLIKIGICQQQEWQHCGFNGGGRNFHSNFSFFSFITNQPSSYLQQLYTLPCAKWNWPCFTYLACSPSCFGDQCLHQWCVGQFLWCVGRFLWVLVWSWCHQALMAHADDLYTCCSINCYPVCIQSYFQEVYKNERANSRAGAILHENLLVHVSAILDFAWCFDQNFARHILLCAIGDCVYKNSLFLYF